MLLQDFKKQNGISDITVLQGQGRMFADVVTKGGNQERLFFSKDCSLTKPMYVNEGVHGVLWVGNNTGAKEVAVI